MDCRRVQAPEISREEEEWEGERSFVDGSRERDASHATVKNRMEMIMWRSESKVIGRLLALPLEMDLRYNVLEIFSCVPVSYVSRYHPMIHN